VVGMIERGIEEQRNRIISVLRKQLEKSEKQNRFFNSDYYLMVVEEEFIPDSPRLKVTLYNGVLTENEKIIEYKIPPFQLYGEIESFVPKELKILANNKSITYFLEGEDQGGEEPLPTSDEWNWILEKQPKKICVFYLTYRQPGYDRKKETPEDDGIYCTYCGKKARKNDKFCRGCGRKLRNNINK
jgi:hypothetical protein